MIGKAHAGSDVVVVGIDASYLAILQFSQLEGLTVIGNTILVKYNRETVAIFMATTDGLADTVALYHAANLYPYGIRQGICLSRCHRQAGYVARCSRTLLRHGGYAYTRRQWRGKDQAIAALIIFKINLANGMQV